MSQKQHVDMFRKLLLRRSLCSKAVPGAAYVPFIGDGDIAVELYAGRKIYGADLDPSRVTTARSRLEGFDIRVADCDGWPFPDVQEPFSIADFDAYCNPYLGLTAFWASANKAKRIVIFGTDGLRQRIKRGVCTKHLPGGEETPASIPEMRKQYNMWWAGNVLPFIKATVAPYRVTASRMYLRKDMLYWGVIADG